MFRQACIADMARLLKLCLQLKQAGVSSNNARLSAIEAYKSPP